MSVAGSAVDTEGNLRALLPLVDQMVEKGLVVLSDVEIIKYSYRAIAVDLAEGTGVQPAEPREETER